MKPIRYGIIGSGMMGQEHMRNIALLDGVSVVAVCDPDDAMRLQAQALAEPDTLAFTDHHALISADICDAYVLAAPNDLHAGLMRDLLATDKPILCEKPLATTSAACRALMRAAEGRRAPVWVAMEYRYMPPVERLRAAVAEGQAGTPRLVSIRENRFPFLHKVGDWNRFNARTGGTMVEKCCHFFDLMRLLLGSDPIRVYASGGADVNHRDESYGGRIPDIVDNAFVTVDFENGARAMLELCMFAEGAHWQEVVSVTGEKARLDACVPGPARFSPDGQERHSEFVISDRASRRETREVVAVDEHILRAGDHHGSTYFQHAKFLELVRAGTGAPEVTLADGYWSVLVGEAAERSIRTHEVIDLRVFASEAMSAA
ncbi:Gfo/Idh/MocA family protein [Roseinatronobacter monicus]|uniref:Putative dehydrogenase n=1 Tax=Roseinatronobacter monicus TaxID=393481 RepID=A0A543KFQ3_9RHOB|nr:Gfo/Idh/MocA family oxidoreductase [Roseinatronobacter monicus]TQM93898.1 putative dehydrogenase [Roseinatronobacter monicus]